MMTQKRLDVIQIAKDKYAEPGANDQPVMNENIEYDSCRLIDENGEQLGIFDVDEALEMAYEKGLDLVEMSASADPPVCKIMNYGKYRYEKQKREKANKNASKQKTKDMKFRCNIGDSDYETKKKHVIRFLEKGNNVRITIMFRGREMSHPDIGLKLLERLSDDLDGVASVLSKPSMEGRDMTMVLAPLQ